MRLIEELFLVCSYLNAQQIQNVKHGMLGALNISTWRITVSLTFFPDKSAFGTLRAAHGFLRKRLDILKTSSVCS